MPHNIPARICFVYSFHIDLTSISLWLPTALARPAYWSLLTLGWRILRWDDWINPLPNKVTFTVPDGKLQPLLVRPTYSQHWETTAAANRYASTTIILRAHADQGLPAWTGKR